MCPPPATHIHVSRSHEHKLFASVRDTVSGDWPQPVATNIPDEDSNLNAGALPDGSVYLFSNCNAGASIRNPLTVAVTRDGVSFSSVWAVISCTELAGPDQPNGCVARYVGTPPPLVCVVVATPLMPPPPSLCHRDQPTWLVCVRRWAGKAKNPGPSCKWPLNSGRACHRGCRRPLRACV